MGAIAPAHGSPSERVRHARRAASRLSPASLGMAVLLHIAVVAIVLVFVHLRAAPAPLEEAAIGMVFMPPPSLEQAPAPPPKEASGSSVTPPPVEVPPPAVPETPAPPSAEQLPASPLQETSGTAVTPPPPLPKTSLAPPDEQAVPAPPPPPPKRTVARTKRAVSARQPETPGMSGAQPAKAAPAIPQPAPIAADWQRSLAAWLAAHKTYPEAARRTGAEGVVVLRFTADRAGHVLNVAVARSAGSPVLDAAAEAIVRGATLPPFSAAMPQDTVTVTVQIHYALTN